jgi:glycosyltransferase involved in cell wall biosynthesis
MTHGALRFSLVVATIGRLPQLDALLESLAAPQNATGLAPSFEVVIVDQSGDDRLVPLLQRVAAKMPVTHLRSPIRAVSHARNLALPHCRGEIACFPDDDCTYPPGVLAAADAAFRACPCAGIIAGIVADPGGEASALRWPTAPTAITRANIWHAVMSAALFVRMSAMHALRGFDQRLGIGADFGAAEETDLVLRAMAQGVVARFDPSVLIRHPNHDLARVAARRAYDYGRGCGFVLRHHGFPAHTVARFAVRPLGGALLAALHLRPGLAGYYAGMLMGRASGFLAGRRAVAHAP